VVGRPAAKRRGEHPLNQGCGLGAPPGFFTSAGAGGAVFAASPLAFGSLALSPQPATNAIDNTHRGINSFRLNIKVLSIELP
jgi:hypothetical protein